MTCWRAHFLEADRIAVRVVRMRTIAIANQKGGVGKTTTALNLCTLLDRAGQRVLLVDLDPQGSSSALGLGQEAADQGQSLVEVLTDGKPLRRACRRIKWLKHAQVTCSGERLGRVQALQADLVAGGQLALRDALKGGPWDTVIIDCPPVAAHLIKVALVAADHVLIPCPMTGASTRGLGALMRSISAAQRLNSDLRIAGVLPTMVRPRRKAAKTVMKQLVDALGADSIFDAYVREDSSVDDLDLRGRPVVFYRSNDGAAQDYKDVLAELNERMGAVA